jgi:uncharacterized repeat protein (TIGR03943 family)
VRREAQAVLLVLLGAVLLRLGISGDYLDYVKAFLRVPLLIAGVFLLGLGAIGFVRDFRGQHAPALSARQERAARVRTHGPGAVPVEEPHDDDHDDEHGGQEGHTGGHGVGWLWCVPIFVLFLTPPPALGSFAAGRQSASVPEPPSSTRYTPLTGRAPITLPVSEYAQRAAWDTSHSLAGRTVALTGFVTPRNDGGWYLTRMKVSCCAADARPYLVEVIGDTGRFSRDNWVTVTGTWQPAKGAPPAGQPAAGSAYAVIRAAAIRQIPQPGRPYE